MNVRMLLTVALSAIAVVTVALAEEKMPTTQDAKENQARLEKVRAEVERRRILRDALAGEAMARQVISDHESGARKVPEPELAAARATVRIADDFRAATAKREAVSSEDRIVLKLPRVDMRTVAATFKSLFGEEVEIADRAKKHEIVLIVSTPTPRAEVREKLIATLKAAGAYLVPGPKGAILDTVRPQPASKPAAP